MQLKRSVLLWHKEATQLSEVINHHSPGGVFKTRLGIHIDQKLEEKKEEKINRTEEYNNQNKKYTQNNQQQIRSGSSEEWISELEDIVVEITQAEQNKEKKNFKK